MREFDYINWLRSKIKFPKDIILGIGDDAAILRQDKKGLFSVDMMMDGVHFDLSKTSPELIGRKALAVNLSDIAAMAGRPTAALVSVAFPRKNGSFIAKRVFVGIKKLADEYGVSIIGGDTNSWDGPLVISITIYGVVTDYGAVLRSGAKSGDYIVVTGDLGGSILEKHLRFHPRISEALAIHKQCELHAMIDLSDGLISDLGHILEESHCGAILDSSGIPISAAAKKLSKMKDKKNIKQHDGKMGSKNKQKEFFSRELLHALTDGEDFELCFTLRKSDLKKLKNIAGKLRLKVSVVGRIIKKKGLYIWDGRRGMIPIPNDLKGYEHQLS